MAFSGDQLLAVLSALASAQRLRIVAALKADGRNYVSQLAREVGISRPLLHLHLQKLEEAGLVSGRPDPADGRQIMLSLTAAAREWIKASRAAREDWLAQAIRSHLSPSEQEELARAAGLLRRIVD